MKCQRCKHKLESYSSVVQVFEVQPDPWGPSTSVRPSGFAHLSCPEIEIPWGPGDEI